MNKIYTQFWKENEWYRNLLRWNWERKYKNWLKFADKHSLWLNVTQEHIAKYLPNSKSADLVAISNKYKNTCP